VINQQLENVLATKEIIGRSVEILCWKIQSSTRKLHAFLFQVSWK
jgi:hypothetical protein